MNSDVTGVSPEPLGTTKSLSGLEQRPWPPGSWLSTDQDNASQEPVPDPPVSILLVPMVTVVEDHRVPGHSSRWPHHFHLLHLNPARSNEKCCEEDNTYKPAVYEKKTQQLETSSLVDAVEANRVL